MEGALSRAGWKYDRVYPGDDDWIEKVWASLIRQRLGSEKNKSKKP
jgi:hypothetical protein